MVDTCGAEFAARTPYFYSCCDSACAAMAAEVRRGLLPAGKAIDVKLPGGMLSVLYTEDGMRFTDDTLLTYEGCFVY